MNIENPNIAAAILLLAFYGLMPAFGKLVVWCCEASERRRNSTPREPNPEPAPQGKTPAELKADAMAWGKKFEASAIRQPTKLGGLPGLCLEREAILEAMRLVRGELHVMRHTTSSRCTDEMDFARAEYLEYNQRLKDVDREIREVGL